MDAFEARALTGSAGARARPTSNLPGLVAFPLSNGCISGARSPAAACLSTAGLGCWRVRQFPRPAGCRRAGPSLLLIPPLQVPVGSTAHPTGASELERAFEANGRGHRQLPEPRHGSVAERASPPAPARRRWMPGQPPGQRSAGKREGGHPAGLLPGSNQRDKSRAVGRVPEPPRNPSYLAAPAGGQSSMHASQKSEQVSPAEAMEPGAGWNRGRESAAAGGPRIHGNAVRSAVEPAGGTRNLQRQGKRRHELNPRLRPVAATLVTPARKHAAAGRGGAAAAGRRKTVSAVGLDEAAAVTGLLRKSSGPGSWMLPGLSSQPCQRSRARGPGSCLFAAPIPAVPGNVCPPSALPHGHGRAWRCQRAVPHPRQAGRLPAGSGFFRGSGRGGVPPLSGAQPVHPGRPHCKRLPGCGARFGFPPFRTQRLPGQTLSNGKNGCGLPSRVPAGLQRQRPAADLCHCIVQRRWMRCRAVFFQPHFRPLRTGPERGQTTAATTAVER